MAIRTKADPGPLREIRGMMRRCRKAVLGTNAREPEGWPMTSLVGIAPAGDGAPVLLLSELSAHTRNLRADGRASIFLDGTAGARNPLTGARVTLFGRLRKEDDPRKAARYLRYNPDASSYADFADFGFFRLDIERAHFVGGFARAYWADGRKLTANGKAARDIAKAEAGILEHMNADHPEALRLYGTVLLGRRGKHWSMIGIDPDGLDLRCGHTIHRLDFDAPVDSAQTCRAVLVALAKEARKKSGRVRRHRP